MTNEKVESVLRTHATPRSISSKMDKTDQTCMTLYYHYIHELCNSFHISLSSLLPPPLPSTIFRNLSLFCQLLGQAYRPLNTLLISVGLRKWWTRKAGPYFGCPPMGPNHSRFMCPVTPMCPEVPVYMLLRKGQNQNQLMVPVLSNFIGN